VINPVRTAHRDAHRSGSHLVAAAGSSIGHVQRNLLIGEGSRHDPVPCAWQPDSADPLGSGQPVWRDHLTRLSSDSKDPRSVPGLSLQRQPPICGLLGQRRDLDQSGPGGKPYAVHGFTGDLSAAMHYVSRRSIEALSLPGGLQPGHGCESGVGNRHHLHTAAERVPLPGGDRKSVLQKCSQHEAIIQP